jgi:YgiT-type zinc finger domain-containing protein
MTERNYPCEFCDTTLEQVEKRVELTLKRGGKIYLFEDVPARVCPNCGHRYYNGPMIIELERLIRENALKGAQPVEAYRVPFPEAANH